MNAKIALIFLLLPLLATAQLKEFEVSKMERPDVAVVQANAQFPDDALLLVYSSLDGLQFRSSMGAVDKQTYNNRAGRYEILVKPVKQMMFVAKPGFMEVKIATINPNPKDDFYYKIEEQKPKVNAGPALLQISTHPSGAALTLNGIKSASLTPYSEEISSGIVSIFIEKSSYESVDTTIVLTEGERSFLDVELVRVNQQSLAKEDKVTIGQEYGGGIVFDVWEDERGEQHGLVVSFNNVSKSGTWFDSKNLCSQYSSGGYQDWYLPTKEEFEKIYENRDEIELKLKAIGASKLAKKWYWTATENIYDGKACAFGFKQGGKITYGGKKYTEHVRAVRAF